jgi:hypothetical protein
MKTWRKELMKYLLVDFGASFVKCCEYDTDIKKIQNTKQIESPFRHSDKMHLESLIDIINNILFQYPECKRVMSCSILGGEWISDIYYSWKCLKKPSKPDCLISKIFSGQPTYHIHESHGGDVKAIKKLGKIRDVLFYSSLYDTYCVIESLNLKNDEYIVNIGTGSQVITRDKIHKYIPAGRALNVFEGFFNSFGFDFFQELSRTTLDSCINSTLIIDLNNFEQSYMYHGGGKIDLINEKTFTAENFLGSILRCLVLQYKPFIINENSSLILTGGIPEKLPVIKKLFEHYYKNTIILSTSKSNTHIGLSKLISKIKG